MPASARSSSISKISIVVFSRSISSPRRQFYDAEPELFDPLNQIEEFAQVDWFRDETVGMKVIAPEDVGFSLRGSQNDYRDAPEIGVAFDFRQDLESAFPG